MNANKKKIKSLITILLGAVLISSCATGYRIDEKFDVNLDNNGIGGYEWEYVSIPEVIAMDSTEIRDSIKEPATGKPTFSTYTKNYTMAGKKAGKYELVFRKKRSFEPDSLIPEKNYKKLKVRILKK